VNLIPVAPVLEERLFQASDGGVVAAAAARGKSRKRVFPRTEEPDPISEAYGYCNTPNRTEQAWEGETHTQSHPNPRGDDVIHMTRSDSS